MRLLFDRLIFGIIYLAIRVGLWIVKFGPRRLVFLFSDGLANLSYYLFQSFRRRSVRNLRMALGDRLDAKEIDRVVRKTLRNFFRGVVEAGYSLCVASQELRREIPVVGGAHLEEAMARGKGVIAIGAHLGNFFLVGTRLALEGYPIHVLVKPPNNKSLRELLVQFRLKTGKKTIHARPRRQAFSDLLGVLRQNELAVVIADEHRDGRGIRVPFFGRTVLARRGPATLALRTGAALLPVYMIRSPSGRLTLIIEPEIKVPRSGDIGADVIENTMKINQWLERVVRSYPDQWIWKNIHWQEGTDDVAVQKGKGYERVA